MTSSTAAKTTSSTYHLGIDLGTTYVAAGILRQGRPEIVTLGDRAPVVPSVLFFKDDGEVLHGESAARRGLGDPTRVVREFKRRVGDSTPLIVGQTPYSADVLLAKLLRFVFEAVVERQGGRPGSIAITHPANWGSYKIDVLHQAVRMAEIGEVTTLTEPVAAAIHYAATERLEPGRAVAVYDLGGGTFDAAVLRRTDGGRAPSAGVDFEVLGNVEGIERLGGIDFDEAVFQHAVRWCDQAIVDLDLDDAAAMQALARLRQECIEAKEALSTDTDVSIPVVLPNLQTEVRLTRAEFEAMIRPLLQQTVDALNRAIRSSGVDGDALAAILLVGGSSRVPLIAEMLAAELGRPIAMDQHPKHTVALGAAIAAGREAGDEVPAPPVEQAPVERALVASSAAPVESTAAPHESQLVKLPPRADRVPAAGVPLAAVGNAAAPPAVAPNGGPVSAERAAFAQPMVHAQPVVRAEPVAFAQPAASAQPAAFAAPPRLQSSPGAGSDRAMPMFNHADVLDGRPRSSGGRGGLALVASIAVIVALIGGAVLALNRRSADDGLALAAASPTGGEVSGGATSSAPEGPSATMADPDAIDPVPTDGAAGLTTTPQTVPAETTASTASTVSTTTSTTAMVGTGRSATISDITITGAAYAVSYQTTFDPVISGDPASHHLHFFFDTVGVENAGMPGAGPWILYDGPSPFQGYGPGDRPPGAERMCVTVATHDHRLDDPSTFQCVDLPD